MLTSDYQVCAYATMVLFGFCAGAVFTLLLTAPGLFDAPGPRLRFGDELPPESPDAR